MNADTLNRLPCWARCLLALAGGALVPLSLAPFDIWPLALVGLTLFGLSLQGQPARTALLCAFCFGIGLYGAGVSWIYVSIHSFGGASQLLAGLLTSLFVGFMAAIFSLPYYFYGRWFSRSAAGLLIGFPAFWLLGEWLRSWLLTGFPWLYLGYGHLDTWLAGWAPVLGVMGVGLIVAFSAALAAFAATCRRACPMPLSLASALCAALWLAGAGLNTLSWTQLQEREITVGMVQPNIPQEIKWDPTQARHILQQLEDMTEELWRYDWVIWPEAAVPLAYHRALLFLDRINQKAADTQTGLITGIIYDDIQEHRYFNSVVGMGDALGIYHKRRLVPFGEYVPLEQWLRGMIQFFDLPTSIISIGPEDQRGLSINGVGIAPSVCYEVVYPDLVARSAREAGVLLTISNDAWFADSIGPLQHMQMARMRALETGRYMIRSTNNGVSALVDPKGRIIARSEQFVAQNLTGSIRPAEGMTPFMRWGSWPLALGGLLLLGLAKRLERRTRRLMPETLETHGP